MAKGTCTAAGCPNPVVTTNAVFCTKHYTRWRRYGTPDLPVRPTEFARFWSKVDASGGLDSCWLWRADEKAKGHGRFKRDGSRTSMQASRYAYELLVGPVPEDLELDHMCHNEDPTCPGGPMCPHRPCCNPFHCLPSTHKENDLRGRSPLADNARKTQCPYGHPFDEANTYTRPRGGRGCRACRKIYMREFQRRRRDRLRAEGKIGPARGHRVP